MICESNVICKQELLPHVVNACRRLQRFNVEKGHLEARVMAKQRDNLHIYLCFVELDTKHRTDQLEPAM